MDENNLENNQNISDKMIGNAISAYLLIFISGLFLFNKTNKHINNDFVKGHTKSAMIIHLGFFVTYIIFITNSLFSGINIIGYGLNNIIAQIIFISLLGVIIIGIYRAKKGLEFKISKNISISKKMDILDINGDGDISEREKLTIILSFIPFIGYLNFGRYKDNLTISEATRLNIIISVFITLLYIFSYGNLANIFSLIYIILIVFIGINLFTRDELIHIKISKVFSPEGIYNYIKNIIEYLKNYFSEKNFKTLSSIVNQYNEKILNQEIKDTELLNTKKDFRPSKILIYIPIINLIFLFFKNTKYSFHIINGITITALVIITGIISRYGYFNAKLHILTLFPIFFGLGYIKYRLAYKMPIIYDIYLLFSKSISFLKFGTKKIKEKRKEEVEYNFKVNQ